MPSSSAAVMDHVLPPVTAPVLRIVPSTPSPEPRSVYAPGGGARPVAMAAAVAVVAAVTAAIATMRIDAVAPPKHSLTVVSMELVPPAPPPPPTAPVPEPASEAQASPAVTVPTPVVALPAPPTPLAVIAGETPAPVSPAPPAKAEAAPAPVSAPVVASAGPVDADLSARMLAATPPRYPDESRRRREEGTVKLAVLVGLDGRVENASVAASSGSDRLDRAALGAVRRWRWSPTLRDGAAVMVRGFVVIPFVLRA